MTDDRRVPITLRMPRRLLDDLKQIADGRSHSMNAEIISRLERSIHGTEKNEENIEKIIFETAQRTGDAVSKIFQKMLDKLEAEKRRLIIENYELKKTNKQ